MQQKEKAADDLMNIDVGAAVGKFVKVHWLSTSLWVIGVLLMLCAPSPVTVSPEMEAEYDSLMLQAQQEFGARIAEAQQETYAAQTKANQAYGWFMNERGEPPPPARRPSPPCVCAHLADC